MAATMTRCGLLLWDDRDAGSFDESSVRRMLTEHISQLHIVETRQTSGPRNLVEEILRRWCDEEEFDLVLTVGGTLPAPGHLDEESVPEATLGVVERRLPGLPEQMRAWALESDPLAIMDRSEAGIRGRSLILNLPSQPEQTLLFLEGVIEVIAPILKRLSLDSTAEEPPSPTPSGLNADEFRRFLHKRGSEESEE